MKVKANGELKFSFRGKIRSMSKVAITCNGSAPGNVFPTLIVGSSAAAVGDEVFLFFTPGGAPALVKGELEKMKGTKGMPNPVELYESLQSLNGKVMVCELALEAKNIKKEDFREGVEVVGATSFICDIEGAQITFSF